MNTPPSLHRQRDILRIRGRLERDGFPRLQMFFLVALTGGSGFLVSFILLHSGLTVMWLRYLAAVAVAYGVFLLLLWLWLKTRAEDYGDVPDGFGSSSGAQHSCDGYYGQGGNSGGGGASSSLDGPSVPTDDSGTGIGDVFESVGEVEEFAIPLIALACLAAMLFSSLFVVYSAPALFAELLVDGLLSASLYRRLRGLDTRHWLDTAVRRTAVPFALTAAMLVAAGWGMAQYAPQAHSIGEVIAYAQHDR